MARVIEQADLDKNPILEELGAHVDETVSVAAASEDEKESEDKSDDESSEDDKSKDEKESE